jgi:glycosyltransferase involved in cell wall biosynthesis
MGQNITMKQGDATQIRVMRIIARMNIGGPAIQVSTLMRGLNSETFDHRLYTGYCSPNEQDFIYSSAPDINTYRVSGLGRSLNIMHDLRAFIILVREIHSFRPHIIHTHTAKAGVLGRLAAFFSLRSSIRVHTFHGHLLKGYFGPIVTLLVIQIERILARYSTYLLAVGETVRQDLLNVGIGRTDRFNVMPPGLDLDELPPRVESIQKLGLDSHKIQCAFIGRVTKIKRPDRFLDVVEETQRRGLPISYFIAGDGELLEECRTRINLHKLPVTLLGWQNNIELILAATDIVILTSDNEGMPLSLIQAGMAAIPVVATGVGSVNEVVINNVTGKVTSTNYAEIANALEELVTDSNLRHKLGSAAFDFTKRRFGSKRLIEDHDKLYKLLLASQAKS